MTRLRALLFAVAATLMATAVADDKPTTEKPAGEKVDAAKLVGAYKLTDGMTKGEKVREDAKKSSIVFTKDKITMKGADDMSFAFSYKVDAAKSPAEIDMEILEPEGFKGSKAKGILKLDAGKLVLAYHATGGDRPAKFESTKDNGVHMYTLEKSDDKKGEEKKPVGK